MRMPRVPRDRKEMIQGASYGSSEVSKDEGAGNHEGVQVGGDASVQAEEQEWWGFEPGVMVMSIVARRETNVRLSVFFMANRMKTTTKQKQIPP